MLRACACKGRVLIIMQDNPDPDALAAADRVDMTCPAHLIEMQKAQHWLGKR